MAQLWQGSIRPAIQQTMGDAGILLVVVVGLLLSPIVIPLAIIWGTRSQKRKLAAAGSSHCGACGSGLGEDAVHLADAEWTAFMGRLHTENPGLRFRVVRWFHAICSHCGQRYRYDKSLDTFTPVEAPQRDGETCLSG